jgi:hypothetical protein
MVDTLPSKACTRSSWACSCPATVKTYTCRDQMLLCSWSWTRWRMPQGGGGVSHCTMHGA